MVRYTAIVLTPEAGGPLKALLHSLGEAFERLFLPYEILCLVDAAANTPDDPYRALMNDSRQLRVLRFDRPRGTSAALSAAIAASRGEIILGIDADVSDAAAHLPHLISRLGRYDFVSVEPLRTLPQAIGHRLARWPRLLLPDGRRGGEPLCFAANRPAVAGISLGKGAFRVLPQIVALRGFRVGRMLVADGLPPRGTSLQSNFVERIVARWRHRRFAPHLALELRDGGGPPGGPGALRPPAGPDRVVAPLPNLPLGQQHGEPA